MNGRNVIYCALAVVLCLIAGRYVSDSLAQDKPPASEWQYKVAPLKEELFAELKNRPEGWTDTSVSAKIIEDIITKHGAGGCQVTYYRLYVHNQ